MRDHDNLQVGRTSEGSSPAVASSSLVLVRDGTGGLEVFMLERHIKTDFAGGALVFPGGKVEAMDRALPPARWTGVDLNRARTRLGASSEADALGLLVAAVREAFEEAGVLLATRTGTPVDLAALASPGFAQARRRLSDRDDPWDWTDWLADEEVVLDLGALGFFAWWVTPDGVHRRYDTRFFVADVPPGHSEALHHDEIETVASRWVRPEDALAEGRAGAATLVFPTRKNLETLAGFPTAAAVVEAAASQRLDTRRLQPRLVEAEGRVMVQHPDGGAPEPG